LTVLCRLTTCIPVLLAIGQVSSLMQSGFSFPPSHLIRLIFCRDRIYSPKFSIHPRRSNNKTIGKPVFFRLDQCKLNFSSIRKCSTSVATLLDSPVIVWTSWAAALLIFSRGKNLIFEFQLYFFLLVTHRSTSTWSSAEDDQSSSFGRPRGLLQLSTLIFYPSISKQPKIDFLARLYFGCSFSYQCIGTFGRDKIRFSSLFAPRVFVCIRHFGFNISWTPISIHHHYHKRYHRSFSQSYNRSELNRTDLLYSISITTGGMSEVCLTAIRTWILLVLFQKYHFLIYKTHNLRQGTISVLFPIRAQAKVCTECYNTWLLTTTNRNKNLQKGFQLIGKCHICNLITRKRDKKLSLSYQIFSWSRFLFIWVYFEQ